MSDRPIFTYQTRPDLTPEQVAVLDAYADLYGQAERCLFAAIQAGGTVNDLKREFQPRFGISARHVAARFISPASSWVKSLGKAIAVSDRVTEWANVRRWGILRRQFRTAEVGIFAA